MELYIYSLNYVSLFFVKYLVSCFKMPVKQLELKEHPIHPHVTFLMNSNYLPILKATTRLLVSCLKK